MEHHESKLPVSSETDLVDTKELTVVGEPAETTSSEHEPYDVNIEGLTPEELRDIDINAAGVALGIKQSGLPAMIEMLLHELPKMIEDNVAAALDRRDAAIFVPAPAPYMKRFYIWKMLWKQVIPAPPALLLLIATGLAIAYNINGWLIAIFALGAVICCVAVLRIYMLWRTTFLVSIGPKTGIQRNAVRWLFIGEKKPKVDTVAIITSEPDRTDFSAGVGLNCWRVSLDTSAQVGDTALNDLRYVRDGEELVTTIDQYKTHAASVRR